MGPIDTPSSSTFRVGSTVDMGKWRVPNKNPARSKLLVVSDIPLGLLYSAFGFKLLREGPKLTNEVLEERTLDDADAKRHASNNENSLFD